MPDVQQLRERIITKTHERFRVEGFSCVTVDDLASSLAISKKTLALLGFGIVILTLSALRFQKKLG